MLVSSMPVTVPTNTLQALLDAYSLKEKLGELKRKKIAIVGDILHSRVALSNIYALKILGAELQVCGPKSLIPKHIEALGVKMSTDLMQTLKWCDAVNMLVDSERKNESKIFSIY